MLKFIIKKILLILFTFIMILSVFDIKVMAADDAGIDDVITGGDKFISSGQEETEKLSTTGMKSASNVIYNVLLSFAVIVAVLWATILGIQYMIGAAESKAQIKEQMIPFIVGCIIVFGSFAIWKAAVLAFNI